VGSWGGGFYKGCCDGWWTDTRLLQETLAEGMSDKYQGYLTLLICAVRWERGRRLYSRIHHCYASDTHRSMQYNTVVSTV
jgi:hypothetical protein